MSARSLPPSPNLDQLKRQAKELLRRQPLLGRLRDAQRALAQEYGFDSWDALRTHVESVGASRGDDQTRRPGIRRRPRHMGHTHRIGGRRRCRAPSVT